MRIISFIFALLISFNVHAVLITDPHDITASGPGSVGYTFFEVTNSGAFDIYTQGPTIDPVLYLFSNDGSLDNGDLITYNDDSCPNSLCGNAGLFRNSLIDEIFLSVGSYIAAISDFPFMIDNAVSGNNFNNLTGLANIVIAVGDTDTNGASARLTNTVSVPEPSTLILFSLGIIGVAFTRRKYQ